MPTIILLDVSLSMCRTVKSKNDAESSEFVELKQLANVGIGCLLDYFAQNAQLEHTALVVFSSLWEIKSDFTRQLEQIKNGIYDLELYDKSNIVNAVRGLTTLKLSEWTQNGPINIVLITDGQVFHNHSIDTSDLMDTDSPDTDDFNDMALKELEGLFEFPCKIQVVCLTPTRDPAIKHSIPFYKSLVALVDKATPDCPVISGSHLKGFKQSAIWLPESDGHTIPVKSVEDLFTRLLDQHYKPYHTSIACGNLSSLVMLSPSPSDSLLEPLKNEYDEILTEKLENAKTPRETHVNTANKVKLYKLSEVIEICGFMSISDVASPAVTSRHLVLPIPDSKVNEVSKAEKILSQNPSTYIKSTKNCPTDDSIAEPDIAESPSQPKRAKTSVGSSKGNSESPMEPDMTKQPSFSVLLHNCLKQENMVAICIVGKRDDTNSDWFGMLHPHIDSKKRSVLMLSIFIPGPSPILWIPSFKSMGSAQLNADLPPAIQQKISNVKGPTTKSYSSNSVIWLDPESVQLDVQKIVRHAKRAPDRAPQFYKELNRIRRAAISYGFYDVLVGLASILDREKRILQADKSRNPKLETLNHLDHVISCLKGNLTKDSYNTSIGPLE